MQRTYQLCQPDSRLVLVATLTCVVSDVSATAVGRPFDEQTTQRIIVMSRVELCLCAHGAVCTISRMAERILRSLGGAR